MIKQPEYNSLTSWCLHIHNENQATYKEMDSETDLSSHSDCNELANEILFVGNICGLNLRGAAINKRIWNHFFAIIN